MSQVNHPNRSLTSDNISGVSDQILTAIQAANVGTVSSYGSDQLSQLLTLRAQEIFESDLCFVPVSTGTAANALALSALLEPYECVLTHETSHIVTDECGAVPFYTAGSPFIHLSGTDGKLKPDELIKAVNKARSLGVHHSSPKVLSLSQTNEWGLVYSLTELSDLCTCAHELNLFVHLDGARFANALASLKTSPHAMSVKAGVDILSLGATKNGALAAEAVVAFNPGLQQKLHYRRKRSGHLLSKMRFLSAQWLGYWQNDHWLDNARHANQIAEAIAKGLADIPSVKLIYPVQANELFVSYSAALAQHLRADGFDFYDWPSLDNQPTPLWRWVTRFDMHPSIVGDLLSSLNTFKA